MDKYKNKYRIPSARLQGFDYGRNGAYFITICTQNREHYFGEVLNNEMYLNEIGLIAEKFWLEIPKHFSFVELGNFVVMPNHTHGILIIDKPVETLHRNVSNSNKIISENQILNNQTCISNNEILPQLNQTLRCNVSTNERKNEQMAFISPKSGSVSTIIRSYKSVVSKHARLTHADFNWQTRFHDHIIRDAQSFEIIQNYIANNPLNWESDKFY